MRNASPSGVPALDDLTHWQLLFAALAIAAAVLLLASVGWRIVSRVDLWQWWIPLALLGGVVAADFGSGIVHWGADTWGRDDCPIIGPRLLVPFRVHHINPDDFLRRRFIDVNGDVALIASPVLLALIAVPLDSTWGSAIVVFGFTCCGIGSMTNQIHQWSHMPRPPWPVRILQSGGLVLGRVEHALHHERPYDRRYCITTGWCNRPLEALAFFRRLEDMISRLTGVAPRSDDRRYEVTFGLVIDDAEPRHESCRRYPSSRPPRPEPAQDAGTNRGRDSTPLAVDSGRHSRQSSSNGRHQRHPPQ